MDSVQYYKSQSSHTITNIEQNALFIKYDELDLFILQLLSQ